MNCRIGETCNSQETHGDFPEGPGFHRLQSLLSVMPRFLIDAWASRKSRSLLTLGVPRSAYQESWMGKGNRDAK
jgi:hypothetical protein